MNCFDIIWILTIGKSVNQIVDDWGRMKRVTCRAASYPGCGRTAVNYIIGAKKAEKGQFPFMVSFIHRLR